MAVGTLYYGCFIKRYGFTHNYGSDNWSFTVGAKYLHKLSPKLVL